MVNTPTSSSSASGTSTSGAPQQQTVADLTAVAQLIGQSNYTKDTQLDPAACRQYINAVSNYQTALQGIRDEIAGGVPRPGLVDYQTAGILNNPGLIDASEVLQQLIDTTNDQAIPAFDKLNTWLTDLVNGMKTAINAQFHSDGQSISV